MNYQEFLASKRITVGAKGITVDADAIHPMLFPFQRDLVRWALRKGRAAIFADCGLGKTLMQLEWARLIGGRVIVIAPLSVARQTVREGAKIGLDVHYTRSGADLTDGINITNYEMIEHFDPAAFHAVVLDECFPPDTPIEAFNIDKSLELRYIKDVREGDKIYNAQGEDYVRAIYKRRINRAVQITTAGRDAVTCSENHPFFTLHGWRCAQDLRPGDYIMETAAAVRLVRNDIPANEGRQVATLLREILLSEMEDEYTRAQGEGTHGRSSSQERDEEKCLATQRQSKGQEGTRADYEPESDEQARSQGESFIEVASDGAQAFRAWGQWDRFDGPATDFTGCAWQRLDSGIFFVTGPTDSGLSHRLQAGLSQSRAETQHRSGRTVTLQPESGRPEEGYKSGFARVDSVEILEQGHPELEKYRDADGHVYFYDIKATRHPSFSVNGLLVHNSSILKALSGHTRKLVTEMFVDTPYRLCCTATPAPNDHVELGNHAEFLGICTEAEMRAMFFINANKEHTFVLDNITYTKKGSNKNGTEWRLKHAAEVPFFEWLASWAISLSKPSDLGYSDDGFILPELIILPHFVEAQGAPDGQLFFTHLHGIEDRVKIRRQTMPIRLEKLKELVNGNSDQWIIWVGLDEEGKAVTQAIPDAVEVKGSDSPEYKAETFEAFQDGKHRVLVSKGKIAGFGLNFWQSHRMVFFGLSDSWEMWYQCIRRQWRFKQEHPVNVHVILSDYEAEIYHNIMRKEAMATRLRRGLIEQIKGYEEEELKMEEKETEQTAKVTVKGQNWTAMLGDSCERLGEIADNSVDLSVYSPPFADLFTYTDSQRDLGNSRNSAEFFDHYRFIIQEVLRVTKPGRITCVHTSDIPAMQERDGYIGVKDFPGDVIRAYEGEGWTFVGRAFIQKNPQAQAIRVKSKALLFVQMRKDSSDSRPALIDQILIFKKQGENAVPITPVANGEMDNETWIEWAHGIWLGIRETDTLQVAAGRGAEDEKHICPLQLGTIERCIKLYSNPGELVLTPFLGIGSEIYQAVKFGRKGIGIELKESYFKAACTNLRKAEAQSSAQTLFDYAEDVGQ